MDLNDRDQGYSQVTYFFEQAMQCGLVHYRAGQERIAVLFQRYGQAVEPVGPLTVQVALEPDLIDHGLPRIWFCVEII